MATKKSFEWIAKAAASRLERADKYPRNKAQASLLSHIHDQLQTETDEDVVKEYTKMVNHLQYQTFDRKYREAVWAEAGKAYSRNAKRFKS